MGVINVGADENDLALVLNIQDSVMQYDIKRKTLKVLCDKGYHNHSFQFIESLMPVQVMSLSNVGVFSFGSIG